MEDSNGGSKSFSHSFCALRKVRFQCYCAQFKFNRIVLVLKLLSMTFYIIVKTLVQLPFVESSLWRIQMLVRRPFLTVFCGLRKVRFQCYCAHFKFNRIFLVLKLLSMTFYIIVETLAQIPFVEASLRRFKKLFRRPFLTAFCALRKVRFHCYCAQFNFNRIVLVLKLLSMTFYIILKTFCLDTFRRSLDMYFKRLVRRHFLTVFSHYAKYVSNATVLSLTSIEFFLSPNYFQRPFCIIVKTLVQISFVESSLWRIQMLVRRPFLTVYCGLRKVHFQCYCAQFKFNRIVLVLKLLSMTFYIIVKSLVQIHFVEASLWRFKKLFRRAFLIVFADYAKYVSNGTVLSSSSIGLFLSSNYFQ